MHRFYIPNPDIKEGILEVEDSRILHQMTKVLRMKPGDKFTIFNELKREWAAEILELNKRKALANIGDIIERETEPDIEVHLYQAIPKKPALFEWVIQKATEIGVSHIYPLITQRTEKRRLAKFERLQTIVIEASEQCRRLSVPVLHHPVDFNETVKKVKAYVAYEYETSKTMDEYLKEIKKQKEAHLFIGPEGGFDQKEIDFALKNKASLFTLGPRILRTETAAIASSSLILLR